MSSVYVTSYGHKGLAWVLNAVIAVFVKGGSRRFRYRDTEALKVITPEEPHEEPSREGSALVSSERHGLLDPWSCQSTERLDLCVFRSRSSRPLLALEHKRTVCSVEQEEIANF